MPKGIYKRKNKRKVRNSQLKKLLQESSIWETKAKGLKVGDKVRIRMPTDWQTNLEYIKDFQPVTKLDKLMAEFEKVITEATVKLKEMI